MIDYYIRYQAVLTANLADIIPTQKSIALILTTFADRGFLPTVVQEISPAGLQNRLRLVSPKGDVWVQIGSTTLQIEKTIAEPKGANMGDVAAFGSDCADIMGRVLTAFNKTGQRLALTTKGFCKEMSEDEMSNAYKKLFLPFPYYNDPMPFEWNFRSAITRKLQVDGNTEVGNSIVAILRQKGNMQTPQIFEEFDRISIETDINTKPENQEFRFTAAHLQSFFASAYAEHNSIIVACSAQIL